MGRGCVFIPGYLRVFHLSCARNINPVIRVVEGQPYLKQKGTDSNFLCPVTRIVVVIDGKFDIDSQIAALHNEFKKADLEKSVNMYLGRMMFRRLSSINQAYYLGHSYYFYQDIHYDQKFLDAFQ